MDELEELKRQLAEARKVIAKAEKTAKEEAEARQKAEKHAKDANEMLAELEKQLAAKDMQVNGSLKIECKNNTYLIKNPKGSVILRGDKYDLDKFTAEHEPVLAELVRRKSAHVELLHPENAE